jgi:hypothetical protein
MVYPVSACGQPYVRLNDTPTGGKVPAAIVVIPSYFSTKYYYLLRNFSK